MVNNNNIQNMAMSYDQRLDTYICPYIYIFHLKTFISAQSRFCSLLSRFSFFLCIRLFLSLLFSLSVFIYLLFNWMYLFRYRAAFLQNCSFFLILRLSLFLALSVCLSLAFALSVFLFCLPFSVYLAIYPVSWYIYLGLEPIFFRIVPSFEFFCLTL